MRAPNGTHRKDRNKGHGDNRKRTVKSAPCEKKQRRARVDFIIETTLRAHNGTPREVRRFSRGLSSPRSMRWGARTHARMRRWMWRNRWIDLDGEHAHETVCLQWPDHIIWTKTRHKWDLITQQTILWSCICVGSSIRPFFVLLLTRINEFWSIFEYFNTCILQCPHIHRFSKISKYISWI